MSLIKLLGFVRIIPFIQKESQGKAIQLVSKLWIKKKWVKMRKKVVP